MDDTIKTNDTDFKGYNPEITYVGGYGNDSISYTPWEYTIAGYGSTPINETFYTNDFPTYVVGTNEDGSLKWEEKKVNNEQKKNHLWKYNEDKILKDINEYVTGTYGSHYCGNEQDYKDIQTIDLMAAKGLAPGFCQANILKYGSRYGSKDGRNKRDLLKVIHYAMLLLHFDKHYSRTNNGLTEFR